MAGREPLRCKRCGCPSVRWAQTNAGKWYLAISIINESGDAYTNGINRNRIPHQCKSHETHNVALEDHRAAFYANRS